MNIGDLIQKNLWAILAGLAMIWGGYLTGTERTTAKLDKMEDKLAAMSKRIDFNDERLKGRYGFMQCSVRTMDKILDKTRIDPPCVLEIPE